MILSDCPTCGRRELRGLRSVHPHETRQGRTLAVTCRHCGTVLSVATSAVLAAPALHEVA